MKVYVGWDGIDALAYEVCKASLLKHASIEVEIIPLREWELRKKGVYWRGYSVDERGQNGTPKTEGRLTPHFRLCALPFPY